jgi:hypothetical protein
MRGGDLCGGASAGRAGSSVSVDKIHTDVKCPGTLSKSRGAQRDLLEDGHAMMQGTPTLVQAHTKAPAVAATFVSLRLGAFSVFRAVLVADGSFPLEVATS